MGFLTDFKTFAIKGNVIDLAVGVIIGASFGKIVSSLVNDIILPPLGLILGGINFKDFKFILKKGVTDASGAVTSPEISLSLGNFLQNVMDFTIIAFVIFLLVKGITILQHQESKKPSVPPEPTNEEKLLIEIRDLLRKQV